MILQPSAIRLSLFAGLLIAQAAAAQEEGGKLYRCRDSKGVTSYQQQPCSKQQTAAGEVAYSHVAEPEPAAPSLPAVPPQPVVPATGEVPPTAATVPAPVATGVPAVPPVAPAPPLPVERSSDAVECLRPDSTTYVRSGQCDNSEVGGEAFEGYVMDPKTGERTWMQGETPRRQLRDPARPLTRSEACRLAKEQLQRMQKPVERSVQLTRDAEGVRDRNCD